MQDCESDNVSQLSHFDDEGRSRMVDVSPKPVTARVARASGQIQGAAATIEMIRNRQLSKGDVLEVARLAGIMAAKRTAELIPLCHVLPLDGRAELAAGDHARVVGRGFG